jgi:uncharacterized paraquat-inducible protein A
VELMGKWAMLDVFALALTVVLVKVGDMAQVEPLLGLWLILAAALLTQVEIRALRRDLR